MLQSGEQNNILSRWLGYLITPFYLISPSIILTFWECAFFMTSPHYINAFRLKIIFSILIFLVFTWIVAITAWLGDDIFISLRQVNNFIHGEGFTYNFNQRVQAFTHPAWMLVLTLFISITRELFYTTLALSIFFSLASVILFFIHDYSTTQNSRRISFYGCFVFLLLSFSHAFTDYMTSGLENPLSYFFIGSIIILAYKAGKGKLHHKGHYILYILLSLAFLNRFDHALLLLPVALFITHSKLGWKSGVKFALPGIFIILSWFTFSLIYFGSLFPNTFYAKLGSGYPISEIYARGFAYFEVTLSNDPITLVLIVSGVMSGFLSKHSIYRALSLGIIFYCLYIIKSGGDFMIGRFFAVPAYVAVFNISAYLSDHRSKVFTNSLVIMLIIFTIPSFNNAPILSTNNYSNNKIFSGIADERGFYYEKYGLLSPKKQFPHINAPATTPPTQYEIVCGGIGSLGLQRTKIYLIDSCGLTDALIARLPAIQHPNWRIGHHYRKIPTDYGNYLTKGVGIVDKSLLLMAEDISLAVSGGIFSPERVGAIMRLNLNHNYSFILDKYSNPGVVIPETSASRAVDVRQINFSTPIEKGALWNAHGHIQFDAELIVKASNNIMFTGFNISLDGYNAYDIIINGKYNFQIPITPHLAESGEMAFHDFLFPEPIVITTVKIVSQTGNINNSMGHFIVN